MARHHSHFLCYWPVAKCNWRPLAYRECSKVSMMQDYCLGPYIDRWLLLPIMTYFHHAANLCILMTFGIMFAFSEFSSWKSDKGWQLQEMEMCGRWKKCNSHSTGGEVYFCNISSLQLSNQRVVWCFELIGYFYTAWNIEEIDLLQTYRIIAWFPCV